MKFRCMLLPGSSKSVEVFRVGRSKKIGSYHGLGYRKRKTRESIINRCRFWEDRNITQLNSDIYQNFVHLSKHIDLHTLKWWDFWVAFYPIKTSHSWGYRSVVFG